MPLIYLSIVSKSMKCITKSFEIWGKIEGEGEGEVV
jgi:hypothetical protein